MTTKAARAAVKAPGKPQPGGKVMGLAFITNRRYIIQLVRYRGFWMAVNDAAEWLDVDPATLRTFAKRSPDVDQPLDTLQTWRRRAIEIKAAAKTLQADVSLVRRRVRDGDVEALTKPVGTYRRGKFWERARELAKDSPFGIRTLADRLRRGWPEELAKSSPLGKCGAASRRCSRRMLATELHKTAHPSLTVAGILRRLHAGWSHDEARLIPKGQH